MLAPFQPISATDMAAFVLAVLALVFFALARRDGEAGMGWLGVGFGLGAAWYASAGLHVPTTAFIDTPALRHWSMVITLSVMSMSIGFVIYLGGPARVRWRVMAPSVLLSCLSLVLYASGQDVPRLAGNAAALICYVSASVLAFMRARSEPGAGHTFIGLALLMLPLTLVALAAAHVELVMLRFIGVLPVIFFGISLLTVSLLRRRRALEAEVARRREAEDALAQTNAGLERAVATRTAELQDLVAGLEGFNRSVSHDLRGPLGGMASLARLALDAFDRGDADTVRKMLAAIAHQADTSNKLVAALLTLARVTDAELAPRTVSLAGLARDVVDELQLAQEGPFPAVDIGPLPEARIDPDLLRPVLVNLIGNAVKFSREAAQPRIRIEGRTLDDAVEVSVSDNGVGFDSARAAQMFEPFARLHGARFEGHGVGLSIVRRAVERHGGRVWAESRAGQGASFHFTLPRAA